MTRASSPATEPELTGGSPAAPGSASGRVRRGTTALNQTRLRTAEDDTLEVIWAPDEPRPAVTELFHGTDAADRAPADPGAAEALGALLFQLRTERRRRRSVKYARLLSAGVAAGLLGVWLLHPPAAGGDENRTEAAFPRVDASGVASGSAFRQTDAALRDRLALREYVVSAIGAAAKNRFGVSLSPQVVLGDGGTPFTAEDFTLPCERPFDPGKISSSLGQLRAIGRRTGKTITVAIAPDKSSILTDQLGRFGSALMSCSNRVRTSTEQQWAGDGTAPVVTMWKQMAAVEKAEPGQAFQHGDTHWTSRGALVFSQTLVEHLIAQGEAPESLEGQPHATRAPDELADADLFRMLGTPRQEMVPVWLVSRPEVTVTGHHIDMPSGRGMAMYQTVTRPGVPLITGSTLVVHDSFFIRAEPQLAPFFQDLTGMQWGDFITAVDHHTLPHFDRIIIETVQRGWPQRATWLEPGQSIYQALAAELATASQ